MRRRRASLAAPKLIPNLCGIPDIPPVVFLLAHDLIQKPVPIFQDHGFPARMIPSENRFPLFGIML